MAFLSGRSLSALCALWEPFTLQPPSQDSSFFLF